MLCQLDVLPQPPTAFYSHWTLRDMHAGHAVKHIPKQQPSRGRPDSVFSGGLPLGEPRNALTNPKRRHSNHVERK